MRARTASVVVAVAAALAGCAGSDSSRITTAPEATATSTTAPPLAPGPNRTTCQAPAMGDVGALRTVAELLDRTDAVVVGTVGTQRVTKHHERPTEPHPPLPPPPTVWVSPDGVRMQGPPENYGERGELPPTTYYLSTDSDVWIEQVLAGSVGSTEAFTLRNLGDGYLRCDPMSPIPELGRRYVFFLGRADWDPSQPPGGVWYAHSASMGRFGLDDDDRLRAEPYGGSVLIPELDGLPLSELANLVRR